MFRRSRSQPEIRLYKHPLPHRSTTLVPKPLDNIGSALSIGRSQPLTSHVKKSDTLATLLEVPLDTSTNVPLPELKAELSGVENDHDHLDGSSLECRSLLAPMQEEVEGLGIDMGIESANTIAEKITDDTKKRVCETTEELDDKVADPSDVEEVIIIPSGLRNISLFLSKWKKENNIYSPGKPGTANFLKIHRNIPYPVIEKELLLPGPPGYDPDGDAEEIYNAMELQREREAKESKTAKRKALRDEKARARAELSDNFCQDYFAGFSDVEDDD